MLEINVINPNAAVCMMQLGWLVDCVGGWLFTVGWSMLCWFGGCYLITLNILSLMEHLILNDIISILIHKIL